MALLTLLARVSDGLPLSASIQDENQPDKDLNEYQQRAKKIFRKLSVQSPLRCSIESSPLVFHYIIEEGVCYLTLCEPSYPPGLAFKFLEAVHQEFKEQHSQDIHKAGRPYFFVEFGTEINRIKRNFQDGPGRRGNNNLRGLHEELQGVQNIMFENIDAVLTRGELIDNLSKKAGFLADSSRQFKSQAKHLNLRTSMAAIIAIVVFLFILIIFVRFWFF